VGVCVKAHQGNNWNVWERGRKQLYFCLHQWVRARLPQRLPVAYCSPEHSPFFIGNRRHESLVPVPLLFVLLLRQGQEEPWGQAGRRRRRWEQIPRASSCWETHKHVALVLDLLASFCMHACWASSYLQVPSACLALLSLHAHVELSIAFCT
jgi:hypothetical protein